MKRSKKKIHQRETQTPARPVPETRPDKKLMAAITLLSVAGAVNAAYLTHVHMAQSGKCLSGTGCMAVLNSSYARIGPVPVSAAGFFMFLVLAWFAFQMLNPARERIKLIRWVMMISLAGTLASAVLTALQGAVIGSWCAFCLASAGMVTSIFILSLVQCRQAPGFHKVWQLPALRQGLLAIGLAGATALFFHTPFYGGYDMFNRTAQSRDRRVAATLDGSEITLAQIDRAIQLDLQHLEQETYDKRRQFLEKKLLEKEAARLGLPVETLIRHETQKGPASYQAYITGLIEKYHAVFSLPLPRRVAVAPPDAGKRPEKGAQNPLVTIVEFSDFQCPACKTAHQRITRLLETYGDQVRLVFRYLPLPQHPLARKAAVMAACLNEQDRFWPFAQQVFAHQANLSEPLLFNLAAQTGSDPAKLNLCIRRDKHVNQVNADIAQATELGISATPAFFINGRYFSGLPENIEAVINEEITLHRDTAAAQTASQ